jgi:integrase
MSLIYRTLQRPQDVLKWTQESISIDGEGRRVITFRQGKAGKKAKPLTIILNADIEEALQAVIDSRDTTGNGVRAKRLRAALADPVKAARLPLISTASGDRYSYEGLYSMFSRHVRDAGLTDYTIYDHKAKGATDMYQAGTSIETICELCNHTSVTTTEIYIKSHMQKAVHANGRTIPKPSKTPETSQGKNAAKAGKSIRNLAIIV